MVSVKVTVLVECPEVGMFDQANCFAGVRARAEDKTADSLEM